MATNFVFQTYVTNIPAAVMPAAEEIAGNHDPWRVERSFLMSRNEIRARPTSHRTREAIEAHPTIKC
jgi:hypothetical protein